MTFCKVDPRPWEQTWVKFEPVHKIHLKMFSAKWWPFCAGLNMLTHCGLVMLYGVGDLGQHWFRLWFGAWQHQAITRTNVDLCLMRPQHIPFRANFSQLSITKIHFKITPYKITADSPWGQWVNTSTLPHPKPLFQVCHAHSSVHHSVCQLSRSQIAQPIHTLVNLPTWLFSQLSTAHPTGAINSLAPKRLWK